jgi:CheY-like chemotaxis protein
MRVLVVDDCPDTRVSLRLLLGLWGHDTREVADGPSALVAAEDFLPQAVLLDLGLPGLNGYEVARRLRLLDGLAGALLLAVSGFGEERDVEQSRAAGFDGHLLKPLDLGELERLLGAPARPLTH